MLNTDDRATIAKAEILTNSARALTMAMAEVESRQAVDRLAHAIELLTPLLTRVLEHVTVPESHKEWVAVGPLGRIPAGTPFRVSWPEGGHSVVEVSPMPMTVYAVSPLIEVLEGTTIEYLPVGDPMAEHDRRMRSTVDADGNTGFLYWDGEHRWHNHADNVKCADPKPLKWWVENCGMTVSIAGDWSVA